MQIKFSQDEILVAMQRYVRTRIALNEDDVIDIDFTSTRGPDGLIATIDISEATDAPEPVKPAGKKVSAPKATKTAKLAPEKEPELEPEAETEVAPDVEPEAPAEDKPAAPKASPFGKKDVAASTDEEAPAPKAGSSIFSKAS